MTSGRRSLSEVSGAYDAYLALCLVVLAGNDHQAGSGLDLRLATGPSVALKTNPDPRCEAEAGPCLPPPGCAAAVDRHELAVSSTAAGSHRNATPSWALAQRENCAERFDSTGSANLRHRCRGQPDAGRSRIAPVKAWRKREGFARAAGIRFVIQLPAQQAGAGCRLWLVGSSAGAVKLLTAVTQVQAMAAMTSLGTPSNRAWRWRSLTEQPAKAGCRVSADAAEACG